MRVKIYCDESYPVYSMDIVDGDSSGHGSVGEIPDDKAEWVQRVEAEYDLTQEYLSQTSDEFYALRNKDTRR